MTGRAGALLAAALLSGGALGAQAPATRLALEAFRDSLAGISDTNALRFAARVTPAGTDSAARAVALLRRGFTNLRLGELRNPSRFRRAEGAFAEASRLETAWPFPVYGRALAKYGISEAQRAEPLELGTRVGVGALDDAVRLLTEAVRLDPSFEPALAALGPVAASLKEPEIWAHALAALRSSQAAARRDPAVLLARGRIEREAGSTDSALAAFDAYLANGGHRGLALLELARTRLANGLPGGDTAYYAGASDDDSASVRGYRDDIAVMLADSELAGFDVARGEVRSTFLRRFWTGRDQIELREPGERLKEHYRRLLYARRNFALRVTRRHYPLGCTYRTGSMEYDDRGVIYIRHGEPTIRLKTYLVFMMPNESWRYARADGDLMFHFGAGTAVDDYRLLSSATDIFGACAGGPELGTPVTPAEVYASRAELDPMYAKLAMGIGTMRGVSLVRMERRIGEASIAAALGSDSYERRFPRHMAAAVSLVSIGRAGNQTLVHVVYGIEGASATGTRQPDGTWYYPVELRFAAYGAGQAIVAAIDTGVVLTTRDSVLPRSMLFGRFALPVPPGNWHYRLSLAQGDSTGLTLPRDSLTVPNYASGLAISEPVLGWRAIALNWTRGADTVFFSPFHSYVGATELELYYEVYGLAPGSAYQTELLVSERKGTRATPVKVRVGFGGVANGAITSGRRTMDLRQFKPGPYWLELVVTDAAGRTERRRTWFEVKALPHGGA